MQQLIQTSIDELTAETQQLQQFVATTLQPYTEQTSFGTLVATNTASTAPITKIWGGVAVACAGVALVSMTRQESSIWTTTLSIAGAIASGLGAYATDRYTTKRNAEAFGRKALELQARLGEAQQQLIAALHPLVEQLNQRWDNRLNQLQERVRQGIGQHVTDIVRREALLSQIYLYETPQISVLKLIEQAKQSLDVPANATSVQQQMQEALRSACEAQTRRYRALLP